MAKDYEEEHEYEVKGERRGKKLAKKRHIMRINSRGLKSVILPIKEKKSKMDYKMGRVTKEIFKTYPFEY